MPLQLRVAVGGVGIQGLGSLQLELHVALVELDHVRSVQSSTWSNLIKKNTRRPEEPGHHIPYKVLCMTHDI